MDHAAVVAGLMGRDPSFGFQHDQAGRGPFAERQGRPKADNAAADDRNIVSHVPSV